MKKLLFISCMVWIASCGGNETAENNGTPESKTNKKVKEEKNETTVSEKASHYLNPALQPYADFTYSPKSNSVFTTDRGTKIEIPKGAFKYKSGEKVDQNVSIQFKEFHTAGEIIFSGIPMEYDSAGIKKTFQTAGMFEIRAFANGEEVDLAEGKTVSVELASTMDGNFNFYQLNDDGNDWTKLASNQKAVKNKKRAKTLDSIQSAKSLLKKPKAPNAYKPGDKLFDIYFNSKLFPQYTALNGVMWKYLGDSKNSDPTANKKFSSTEWEVVQIEPAKEDSYCIRFKKDNDTISVMAQPVFKGTILTKENEKFKTMLDNFNADYNRLATENERAEKEMALLRKFNVSEMGIYNYDRYYKNPEVIPLLASFDFHQQINLRANPVSVYLIPEGENAVIKYVPDTYEKFSFDPAKVNKLIAVLPDGSVCTYSSKGFKNIKRNPDNQAQRFMFDMNVEEKVIKGPKDIDNLLAKSE